MSHDKLQSLTLAIGRNHLNGRTGIRIPLLGSVDQRPSQPIGHHAQRAHLKTQGQSIAVARLGPALTILDEFIENFGSMIVGQLDLTLGIVDGIFPEIIATRKGIRPVGVLIGGIRQQGIIDSGENALELIILLDDGVAVFDSPQVIRTHFDHSVVSLFFTEALQVHVHGQVIHDRAREGFLAFDLIAVDRLKVIDA